MRSYESKLASVIKELQATRVENARLEEEIRRLQASLQRLTVGKVDSDIRLFSAGTATHHLMIENSALKQEITGLKDQLKKAQAEKEEAITSIKLALSGKVKIVEGERDKAMAAKVAAEKALVAAQMEIADLKERMTASEDEAIETYSPSSRPSSIKMFRNLREDHSFVKWETTEKVNNYLRT